MINIPTELVPPSVKNLVFDLGGVVIDIDPSASFAAMQVLAADSVSIMDQFSEHTDVFLDYEKGLIDDNQFRAGVRELTQQPDAPGATIDEAWCRMLLNVPWPRLQLLAQLKQQYRTFVLSNTNRIHVTVFNTMIAATSEHTTINPFFEKVYYSHELKMRKPEAKIYQHVLEDSNLLPYETLFLDDREENLVAARALGIKTQLVTPQYGIIDIFS